MKIGVAKAIRSGRKSVLMLAVAGLASAGVAQTVPQQDLNAIAKGLDLPENLTIFGTANPSTRKATAVVNDSVITGTDVEQRVNLIIGLNKLNLKPQERDELRLTVLRQLIDETLQIQEAKANDIVIDKKEIDSTFARVGKNYGRDPDQFRGWLRQMGTSERSLRRQVEGELAWARLLRRRVDINVSDAEVKEILARLEASKGTEEYHLFEIYQNATPDRAQEVATGMQRMIQQMREGTPFDYLAKTYSESSTKSQGGDLSWVRPGMLPDALANAVQTMQPGQVAGPIELPTGFSILYLAEKRQVLMADPKDAKVSLRQITVHFAKGTTEERATAIASEFATATQAIQGCGDVARVAAAQNAEVADRDGLVIKDMPPGIQNLLLPLQVGQVTRPFGAIDESVSVLVVCGRDDPPSANLPSEDQLKEGLEEQRTNIRAQRMLRDLRRDALVEYR
ncbi:peptidylprolyl isomerase [Sphingomonas sp.]|uniref:peptidylprolyl isomerase n=1 Tax=Sphingomonas sp. TaxID=28214 RepID=UPI0025FBF620|nr:peptidylprolyl isomerase [Sphingomonas sp.]